MSQRLAPQLDIAALLRPVLAGSPATQEPPVGLEPLGAPGECPGCDPAEIPQTIDELGELVSYTYDLTVRRAGELSIPVVGSLAGGFDRRVVVYEWTRYKEISGAGGIRCLYGYVIRFCLTVSKWDAQVKVSLPFLSAQAELGNLQATWLMQVRGLVGPKIDAVVLPPQELKVETFVIARQSLEQVIAAVADPTTQFRSGILVARISPLSPEAGYWRAAVQAFAIDSVRRGRARSDAQSRLGSSDSADWDTITEAYTYLGVADPNANPGSPAREQAERLLRGVRVDK